MALIKLNDRAVKDVTQFGSISSLGSLVHISTATASSSASIEFSLGDYKEYKFFFVNIHPSTSLTYFTFQCSTDGGSNYNTTMTTTVFDAYHDEADLYTALEYRSPEDQAQGTAFQKLSPYVVGNENDSSLSGSLNLFNPSSTTYVKHFIANTQEVNSTGSPYSVNAYVSGYFNDTNDLTNIKFQMSSGNIDAGQILLFGVN